jgi:uncharacterized protein
MGFIRKLFLPNEVDFNLALSNQVQACKLMIDELYKACVNDDADALQLVAISAKHAREIKTQNMMQLLNVFITPYDKESIYRMINQLDWIALSIKHFQLEAEIYDTHSLSEYEQILKLLVEMMNVLEDGISKLATKKASSVAVRTDQIYDKYDLVIELCAKATATLMAQDDFKRIMRHKDMLLQLKEIAKRIHVAANTLEDMAIKIV